MASGKGTRLTRHKYAVLLALMLVSLAIQSTSAQIGIAGLVSDVNRTVVSVVTFAVVFERPWERRGMALILVAILGIGWSRNFAAGDLTHGLAIAFHVLIAMFLAGAVYVILRELFRGRTVGAENVLGAVCGYLIAGDAWASINTLAYLMYPGAFSVSPDLRNLLVDWHGRMALFSYYSLAQMLTIGYADVTPVRPPATILSLFGALFGMFYTAVVVAQFVGLAQSGKAKDETDP